jgi:hypothetical protein
VIAKAETEELLLDQSAPTVHDEVGASDPKTLPQGSNNPEISKPKSVQAEYNDLIDKRVKHMGTGWQDPDYEEQLQEIDDELQIIKDFDLKMAEDKVADWTRVEPGKWEYIDDNGDQVDMTLTGTIVRENEEEERQLLAIHKAEGTGRERQQNYRYR